MRESNVQKMKEEFKHLKFLFIAYILFSIIFISIFITILYSIYSIAIRTADETINFFEWIINLLRGVYN